MDSYKKKGLILIAVAFVLTVLSIVALSVGMQYLPLVFESGIDDKGVPYRTYVGPLYNELGSILATMIAAVIGNFILFVYMQMPYIRSDKGGVKGFAEKVINLVLHILGAALTVGPAIIAAALYLSDGASNSITTDAWILGAYGMCSIAETITVLTYYWNNRFFLGPAGADFDYVEDHKKLNDRSKRADKFEDFYIAVPYVAFAMGYFVSVLLGSLAGKLGKVMNGGVHLIIIAVAIGLSVYFFIKKYRISKSDLARYHARNNSKGGGSGMTSFVDTNEENDGNDSEPPQTKKITREGIGNAILHTSTPCSGMYTSVMWGSNRPMVTSFDNANRSVTVKGALSCKRKSNTFRSGSDDTDEFNFEEDLRRMCREAGDEIYDTVVDTIDDSKWNVKVVISGHDDRRLSYTYSKD